MQTSTTYTVKLGARAPDWCEKNKVAHAWIDGPTLTVDPPIQTRVCVNCGRRQRFTPGQWSDE